LSNTVFNNTANLNTCGISLLTSDSNTVSGNNACLNYYWGIHLSSSNTNTISINNVSLNYYGIHLEYSSNSNTISSNTANLNDLFGIWLNYSNRNTISYNNVKSNVNAGIGNGNLCCYNRIHHNNFIDNNAGGKQASDESGLNFWNSSGSPHGYGNYWSDWSSPDNNTDGIVDFAYYLDGSKGANDSFPIAWTSPPVSEIPLPTPIIIVFVLLLTAIVVKRRRG
jgi:parallel beta-helix repeat protein